MAEPGDPEAEAAAVTTSVGGGAGTTRAHADAGRVVIAGAGVVGTWHAIEFLRAGFTVDHLEAAAEPAGASVRNFGLVWVSGRRSGPELDAALRSRFRWEEIGDEVPLVRFRPQGSLTIALDETERAVMETFARLSDAGARAITFLDADDVRVQNPAVRGDVAGALFCANDATVEPRHVLPALRRHLRECYPERYHFRPRHCVVGTAPGALVDASGTRWQGDLAVVAPGAAYDRIPGTGGVTATLRRVRLQMLETAPLGGTALRTALADADSLRYYPAYEVAPLERLAPPDPVAAEHHLQLLLVQRPDGGLTIGDTHAYDEPFDFAVSEHPMTELMARAERILGTQLPPVCRRWDGVYAQCIDQRVCLRDEIEEDVWLVTGPGGRGMTCAPAIAADTLVAAGIEVAA
jgi:FAD dependent oxidoreductase TIGR03364